MLPSGLEPERRHPPACLAIVEAFVLEVVEEVAGETQLRCGDGVASGELESERRLGVVQDQAVVLAELARRACRTQHRHLVVRHDRQLERVLEADAPSCVPLHQNASALVHQCEAAPEMARHDGQQALGAATVRHCLREPFVYLEGLCDELELLARQVAEDGLRDGDERHLVRHLEDREALAVGLLDERRRHRLVAEAEPEAQPGQPVTGEPADVGALLGRVGADPEPGRQEELAAFEPRRRVGELRGVEPADVVREARGARRDPETQGRKRDDVLDGEHGQEVERVRRAPHLARGGIVRRVQMRG